MVKRMIAPWAAATFVATVGWHGRMKPAAAGRFGPSAALPAQHRCASLPNTCSGYCELEPSSFVLASLPKWSRYTPSGLVIMMLLAPCAAHWRAISSAFFAVSPEVASSPHSLPTAALRQLGYPGRPSGAPVRHGSLPLEGERRVRSAP